MISDTERDLRKNKLGSSDAAAVLGLDPYRGPADVWLEKTGRADGFEGNEHTDRGTLLEPVILQWAEQQLGTVVRRNVPSMLDPSGLLIAHLDGDINDDVGVPDQIVEAKSSVMADEWGKGADEVPKRVLVQVHHQFAVAGPHYRLAWVPVLLPGYRSFDFRMYRVDRDDELAAEVMLAGLNFMERFVRADTPPQDYRPSIEVLRRVRREPGKSVPIPDLAVTLWQAAQKKAKDAKDECERAAADVVACLGDAEAGECKQGLVTYIETKRKAYTVEASAYRQLRLKAAKGNGSI